MAYLDIKDMQVTLGGQLIIKGIDLSLEHGEFLSLLGPSGCGKSTLLKTVAGLLTPDSCGISLNGERIERLAPEKRQTVVVFQDLRLFPHMSVSENVEFAMKVRKVDRQQRGIKSLELLERVGLGGMAKRKVASLSGGQQQRVALARALAAEPRVLLLDEPFSSLDEHLRQRMRDLVLSLHRDLELATILVTHDHREALMMSDRVAVMRDGLIVQCDVPSKIYEEPATPEIADYFGQLNYVAGHIVQGVFTSAGELIAPMAVPGEQDGEVLAMIKPSSLQIDREGSGYKIQSIAFMGDYSLLTVERNGQPLLVSQASATGLAVGSEVGLTNNTDRTVYYRA
jgi:ABC-type Fe3+/spermidine/putrescine transport system ATPase subunit